MATNVPSSISFLGAHKAMAEHHDAHFPLLYVRNLQPTLGSSALLLPSLIFTTSIPHGERASSIISRSFFLTIPFPGTGKASYGVHTGLIPLLLVPKQSAPQDSAKMQVFVPGLMPAKKTVWLRPSPILAVRERAPKGPQPTLGLSPPIFHQLVEFLDVASFNVELVAQLLDVLGFEIFGAVVCQHAAFLNICLNL